mmetsp:Transcript_14330/g.42027  ORF Transcript_14330/g.42027 Transcript_14330/m.42027 type:complete len:460 (-) Transcript_14330:3173-4552(-)
MSATPADTERGEKVTKVQLSLHATRLRNVAGMGKGTSDPYAVVTLLAVDSGEKPHVLGNTEVIKNSLNPQWTTSFLVDFEFGKPTHVNVGVYDQVQKSGDKPMGSASFELGDILGAKGNIKAKKLKLGGALFAHVIKAPCQSSGDLTLGLSGIKLKNVEGFFKGKSDPFYELLRRNAGTAGVVWRPVYRSPHISDNLNPVWPKASIGLDLLCDGDMEKPIQIAVYDHEKNGKHKPMGIMETCVSKLLAAETPSRSDRSKAFTLKRKEKDFGLIVVSFAQIHGKGAISGGSEVSTERESEAPTLSAPSSANKQSSDRAPSAPPVVPVPPIAPPAFVPESSNVRPVFNPLAASAPPVPTPSFHSHTSPSRPTFVDYISGGAELQMCVAIDYTGSNGDPRIPGTLHYMHQDSHLNDYEKAISAVGSIVAKYDSDKKNPCLGFWCQIWGNCETLLSVRSICRS